MWHVYSWRCDIVKRLLRDPRVRATIDVQNHEGSTALHWACKHGDRKTSSVMVRRLLEAGASPVIIDNYELTPLALLQAERPTHHVAIALLEQALANAETTSLLVKARRLTIATRSNIVAPSCLHARVARGQPLPRVELVPVVGDQNGDEDEEDHRKLCALMECLLGMGGGPEGEGMPRDVFRVVLDLLMPSWDPLRNRGGAGPPVQGGKGAFR